MAPIEKRILKESEEYARASGLILNPDKKIVEAVVKGLAGNFERHGKAFCPCRAITGKKELDKKIVCPCAYHLQEIKETDHCRCQLFFKKPPQ
jgi:ferredoxin-thioredoxin reductase catalytic subunit